MNIFSKFLNSDPEKYSRKTKTIIFSMFMLAIISFFVIMAVVTFMRGAENFESLTHARGIISGERIMKHKQGNRYGYEYKNVLVVTISGCSDEFGFMEYSKSYSSLRGLYSKDKQLIADIYYSKSRKRIEENVTLHIFDLAINGETYINIEEMKKSEWTGTLIFSLIATILIWLTVFGIKRINIQRPDGA